MTNSWFHKISSLDSVYAKTGERHRKYQRSSQYHRPLTGGGESLFRGGPIKETTGIAVADLAE